MFNRRTAARFVEVTIVSLWLVACGGGGGGGGGSPPPSNPPQNPPPPPPQQPQLPDPATAPALRTELGSYFLVGAALEPSQLNATTNAADVALLQKHFSSITAENVMKPSTIGVAEDDYNFGPADQLVAFAKANNIMVRGHTLVWHQTAPDWFFEGNQSDPATYHATVKGRLERYITDVVSHFGDDIYAWDVVNEVASDTPGEIYRTTSPWYIAYSVGGNGEDYIEDAFRAARAANPNVKLFLNDYSTEFEGKRANVLAIVQDLIDKGVPINGVGHQFHISINTDSDSIDEALSDVEELSSSLLNQVTELDVSIYNDPGSCFGTPPVGCASDYGTSPPNAVLAAQARLYREVFEVIRAHDTSVDSVTFWGISDAHTWLNFWPVNRTNRPLLFDRDGNPKLAFWAVVDPTFTIP